MQFKKGFMVTGPDPNIPMEVSSQRQEIPSTGSLHGRSIDPHPEKSSIFKDIIKSISRVASTILIVPVIAAGVALGIANKLSSRSSEVGSTRFGATASKIRTFALRYLLIAPLGKRLLGDKAEPIASVKAKFEGLLTNSKHPPRQKENIQKAFTLIESAISS